VTIKRVSFLLHHDQIPPTLSLTFLIPYNLKGENKKSGSNGFRFPCLYGIKKEPEPVKGLLIFQTETETESYRVEIESSTPQSTQD